MTFAAFYISFFVRKLDIINGRDVRGKYFRGDRQRRITCLADTLQG